MNGAGILGLGREATGLVISARAGSPRGSSVPPLGGLVAEDLLYLGFQGRFLEASVTGLASSGLLDTGLSNFGIDVRTTVIARAMRRGQDGQGDLCHPGVRSPGPALAFGATPLEVLRHLARKGTTPASARTGGQSWTDARRGVMGWGGTRGGMMTQVLAGAALACKRRGEDRAALVFEARAALQAGGWHEGMNLAGAVRSPLIVVVEGGLPPDSSGAIDVEAVAASYGVAFERVAEDAHERVFRMVTSARRRAVSGEGPAVIELVPLAEEDSWALHDEFAARVVARGDATRSALDNIESAAATAVDHASRRLNKEPGPSARDALAPVLTDAVPVVPWTKRDPPSPAPPSSTQRAIDVD